MPYKDKEKFKSWIETNKEKVLKHKRDWYHKNKKNDNQFSVYLIPNENYVGQTNNIYKRMCWHKHYGRDISDYKVLHTFDTREEALAKEKEYHAMGYNG